MFGVMRNNLTLGHVGIESVSDVETQVDRASRSVAPDMPDD